MRFENGATVLCGVALPSWHTGRWRVGQAVLWRGIWLVCCANHVAPAGWEHPWDDRSDASHYKSAGLWTPNGEVQCADLRRLVIDNRQSWSASLRIRAWSAATGERTAKAA